MERCADEVHQALWGLRSLPGALVELPHVPAEMQPCSNAAVPYHHPPSAHGSAHRRALRKLDRALQSLQTLVEQMHQGDDPLTDTVHSPCVYECAASSPDNESMQLSDPTGSASPNESIEAAWPHHPSMHQQEEATPSDNSHDTTKPNLQNESAVADYHPVDLALSEPLVRNLRIILTQLAVPTNVPNDTMVNLGELAVTILDRASYALRMHEEQSGELVPLQDIISMLHRLVDTTIDSNADSSGRGDDVQWSARSIWLRALNAHFMRVEHQRVADTGPMPTYGLPLVNEDDYDEYVAAHGNIDHSHDDMIAVQPGTMPAGFSDTDSAVLPGWVVVQYLPQLLRMAIEMVQLMPWEPSELGSTTTETRIQWRILTGFMIEHAIQLQQDDDLILQQPATTNSLSTNAVEQWLMDRFQEAQSLESHDELVERSQHLLSDLTMYAVELTEYALDALDGASVSFAAAKKGLRQVDDSIVDVATMQEASTAVQDSLRHVALATNVVEALERWNSPSSAHGKHATGGGGAQGGSANLMSRLWKATTESFMSKSSDTTIFNLSNDSTEKQALHQNQLASLVCYHQLRLADLFLSSSSRSQTLDQRDEFTLTLTFLRALDFPDQLLDAQRLWHDIEQRVVDSDEHDGSFKKTLQVAVLTLCAQHMLHHGNSAAVATMSPPQKNAQAIVDRILTILMPTIMATPANSNMPTNASDSFFLRQLGYTRSTPTGRMAE